jgi:hypothetical protein
MDEHKVTLDHGKALAVFAQVGVLLTSRPPLRKWTLHERGVLRDAIGAPLARPGARGAPRAALVL